MAEYEIEIDGGIVSPGLPIAEGVYLLWWDEVGWPTIHVIRVEEVPEDGRLIYWNGTSGTDRLTEVPGLFHMGSFKALGHSAINAKALEHYETKWQESRRKLSEYLRKRDKPSCGPTDT